MMIEASATFPDGSRVEDVLGKLVADRMRVMNENVFDAIVATAINSLVSIRSATLKADERKAVQNSRPNVQRIPGWRVSFDPRTRHRCVRGLPKGSSVIKTQHKLLFAYNYKDKAVKPIVFLVTPKHERTGKYYLATTSEAEVFKYEARRVSRRVVKAGGLAKLALGICAAALSTKPDNTHVAGFNALRAARMHAKAMTALSGNMLSVEAQDTLEYAISALPGGQSDVVVACKKAANKTYGILAHYVAEYPFLDPKRTVTSIPFPEVSRRLR